MIKSHIVLLCVQYKKTKNNTSAIISADMGSPILYLVGVNNV